jgi:hypothetical protein
MTVPDQPQQIADETHSLESKVGDLQESVRLSQIHEEVEDLQTTISGLVQRVANLRTRGYVFEKGLENQGQSLTKSWISLYPNIESQINLQSSTLANDLRPIEMQMPQLATAATNPGAARSMLNSIQSSVNLLEEKISATERTITGMYDQLNG